MNIATGSLPKATTRNAADAICSVLGGRRGLLVIGALVLGFSLILKWNWLVAAGIAPLLLSALHCVEMCALGLCIRRMPGSVSDIQVNAMDKSTDVTKHATAPLLLTGPDVSSTAPTTDNMPTNVVQLAQISCCHNPR